jgi:hypothetical protein
MNQGIDYSAIPLRDIHLPAAISWWPPAPGWWLIGAFVIGVLVYYLVRYVRQFRQRNALKLLNKIKLDLEAGVLPETCLQVLSSVMRRFAMSVAINPALVAGLIGKPWLQYLDSCWQRDAFCDGPGSMLTVAPYAPANSISRDAAIELTSVCIDWVRQHRAVK